MATRDHSFQNKRKYSRYSVIDSSAVMLPSMHVISYRVLDISKSGLSFCYNGEARKKGESNMVMTFFSNAVKLIDFPVQVISDTELNINHLPDQFELGEFRNHYLRRCGVKFNQLSFEQKETIKFYIHHIEKTSDTTPR